MARKKRELDYKAAYKRLLNKHKKVEKELGDYKVGMKKALEYIFRVYRDKDVSSDTLAKMTLKSIQYNLTK